MIGVGDDLVQPVGFIIEIALLDQRHYRIDGKCDSLSLASQVMCFAGPPDSSCEAPIRSTSSSNDTDAPK